MGQTSARQTARLCALSEIDRNRALPFASLSNGTTAGTVPGLPGGTIATTISSFPDGASLHLKRVVVTVRWTGGTAAGRISRAAGEVTEQTLVVEQ